MAAPADKKVRQQEARRLSKEGLSHREIAERMSVSLTTVYRWCDPEAAERARRSSRDWKARNKKHLKKYHRERHRGERKPCPECGDKMSSRSQRCKRCYMGRVKKQHKQMVELWNKGWTAAKIAETLGTTAPTVYVQLARMRREGQAIPHRYPKNRRRQLAEASKKATTARKAKS